MHTYIHMQGSCAHKNARTHTLIHTHVHAHTHAGTHTHTHTHHTQTQTHTHIYTHKVKYMHKDTLKAQGHHDDEWLPVTSEF
jgi:hypothetical protein